MSLDASVTHYIGDSIPISLKRQLSESTRPLKVQLVSVEWLFASIQRQIRAPSLAYSLTRPPKGMATSAENPNFVAGKHFQI